MRASGSLVLLAATARVSAASNESIPDYVLQYAPIIYLDVNEEFYPSDIAAQLATQNTYPAYNYTVITNGPSNLTLGDMTALNTIGQCDSFATCNIYLTSKQPMTVDGPFAPWLHGVQPNPQTGETDNATSCAVIVRAHNDANNTVDAFYMYFYAFNRGTKVANTFFDNHVGDWEHTMVRFVNGTPSVVYFSIHSGGTAYTYDSVLKDNQTHSRPIGFASVGGHATYPQPGLHSLLGGIANDSTSYGPRWDPVAGSGAWYYTFVPNDGLNGTNGTFTAIDVANRTARGTSSTDWLYFLGQWGDEQYNSSYPNQQIVPGVAAVFASGPTGPLDKDLVRSQACPGNSSCPTQTTVLPASGSVTQTVSRTYSSVSSAAATSTTTASASGGSASSAAARTSSAASTGDGGRLKVIQWPVIGLLNLLVMLMLV